MLEYVFTVIVGIIQIFVSIDLIVRKKNSIAILSEIISSLVLLYILSSTSCNYIGLTLLEYVFVKIFLVVFMIIARVASFKIIKLLSSSKKKQVNVKVLNFVQKFYKAKYWPRLKLGLPGMANKTNSRTKVRFDSKGFPKFKVYYRVKLKRKYFRESREKHFYVANKILYKNICSSSRLKHKFSNREISDFSQGKIPSKYTWHHHQDAGVLELVEADTHSKTSHIGGYSIWGGK